MSDLRLGKLRLITVYGSRYYISPDVTTWVVPTAVTLGLTGGTLWVATEAVSYCSIAVLVACVATALGSSLACGISDPGVVPRPSENDPDPNLGDTSLRLCEYCNLRRPQRTSHCHICNVCVLEHDHHCGVIGGCVGQRSLRWFTLYLLCITAATAQGTIWLLVSLIRTGQVMSNPSFKGNAGGTMATHIMLLIFVGNVCLIVGCLAFYYVYLALTDTTRREAQKKALSVAGESAAVQRHERRAAELRNRFSWRWFGRLGRVMFPPPSLLDDSLNSPGTGGGRDAMERDEVPIDMPPRGSLSERTPFVV